jgi:hypothetical protein
MGLALLNVTTHLAGHHHRVIDRAYRGDTMATFMDNGDREDVRKALNAVFELDLALLTELRII